VTGHGGAVFTTPQLTVGRWTHRDAATLLDIYSRWEVARWLGAAPRPLTNTGEALLLADQWAARSRPDPTFGVWRVTVTGTGTAVGTVLLVPLRGGTAGEVEVGWHLHPDHWGNGYATEAASGAIARGLAAGLPEVLAVVRPDNAASQAVCRRLGMRALGLSEQYYGTALEVFSAAADGAAARHPIHEMDAGPALPDLAPTATSVMG
jgi:RimJ/RimL family protein N-acetyltransferase